MTRRIVPRGGYCRADGRILTRTEVTRAVRNYARKHGHYARTVREDSYLFRAAVNGVK